MKLCLALDDFSEEIMNPINWGVLMMLRQKYPKFKVTMFTIPEQCSDSWILDIHRNFPWIEMAVHGTDHKFVKSQIPKGLYKMMTSFYKAPRWKLTDEEFKQLKDMGYKIATNKPGGDYVYNDGEEIIKDIHYKIGDDLYSWHGHVQSQRMVNPATPNGLPDVYKLFLEKIPVDTEFVFLSEIR